MNSIFSNALPGDNEDEHIYTLKELFNQNNNNENNENNNEPHRNYGSNQIIERRSMSPNNKYKEFNSKDFSDSNNRMMDIIITIIETEAILKVVVKVEIEIEKEVVQGKGKENEIEKEKEKAVQENIVEAIVEIIEELIKEMKNIEKDMINQRTQGEIIKNHILNFAVWKMV